jgi:AraC-like DNA-binding protein
MPRQAVLSRNPALERRTAEAFDTRDAGTLLLRSLVLNTAESTPTLREEQRGSALASIIQLLGALRVDREAEHGSSTWRVRAALACIDSCLADPELTATRVAEAQGVSRRRLDQIMVEATGEPLSSQIWLRRLEQAANDLLDPRFANKTVTQIAFAAGFEDVAHFTRAFKRRYQMPPREWRNAESALRHPGAVHT